MLIDCVRNIQCISYLILFNGYRHMIKSDALHKQIASYMPIDCHDLKTNGTKEWHVGNIISLFKSSIFKSFMLNSHVFRNQSITGTTGRNLRTTTISYKHKFNCTWRKNKLQRFVSLIIITKLKQSTLTVSINKRKASTWANN
ncbi:hypothetical protein T08_7041 [Trichinella sp. T8]|nr:hypothetical protein T08_7041 [Trichinella sp. T8]